MNQFSSQFLCREMAEQAVTVLKNETSMLPLQRLDTLKIAALAIGGKKRECISTAYEFIFANDII